MARSLYPVMRAILGGPCPWLVRSRSWSAPGGSGSAGDRARSPAGSGCQPDVVGAGGDGADGQPGADERAQAARRFVSEVLGPGHPCGDVAVLLVSDLR
jgi:hypothetical protein